MQGEFIIDWFFIASQDFLSSALVVHVIVQSPISQCLACAKFSTDIEYWQVLAVTQIS